MRFLLSSDISLFVAAGIGYLSSTRRFAEGLLLLSVFLNDQGAARISAKALPSLRRQFRRELEAARALYGLDGDLEIGKRLLVRDAGVRKHEGADSHLARARAGPLLGEDDLVEVRGHGDVRGVTDDLVLDVPFVVCRVALRQVQRSRHYAHARVFLRQPAAEVLEVRPVVAVEALADLGRHVGEVEGLVHGALRPLGVGRGDLVAAVVARAEVVLQLGAELLGNALVF